MSQNEPLFKPDAAIAAVIGLVASALADELERRGLAPSMATPRYYSTAEPGPLMTSRAFADAARSGAFPTFKVCRRVTAHAADVHAYVESRTRAPRTKVAPSAPANDAASDDRAVLEQMGVKLTKRAAGAR